MLHFTWSCYEMVVLLHRSAACEIILRFRTRMTFFYIRHGILIMLMLISLIEKIANLILLHPFITSFLLCCYCCNKNIMYHIEEFWPPFVGASISTLVENAGGPYWLHLDSCLLGYYFLINIACVSTSTSTLVIFDCYFCKISCVY